MEGIDNNIIVVENLTKKYGNHYVFKDANITIRSGITGIVAPNGFGKTTFIEMCVGVRKNYTGEIKILGKMPDEIKNNIGFVADKPSFPRNIKVQEYLNIVSEIYKVPLNQDLVREAKIDEILNVRIGDLSAGYLKRLAFLIAVMHSPKIVFADEIFANVDRGAVVTMKKMVLDLNKSGISFIISSHDLNDLADLADRIIIIKNNGFEEIQHRRVNLKILRISSEDDNLLYELLKKDFQVERDDEGLIVYFNDLKKVLEIITKFDKEIFTIKTEKDREEFLNEIYKSIYKD